jgi:hypothetical protein
MFGWLEDRLGDCLSQLADENHEDCDSKFHNRRRDATSLNPFEFTPSLTLAAYIWKKIFLGQSLGFIIIPVHAALNKHISCHMVFYVTVETFLMTLLMNCLRILWAWFDLRSCAGGIGWSSGSWVGRSLAFSLFAQSSRSSGGLAFNMGSLVLENRHELCC